MVWKQTRKRNEALDTFVYGLAAIHILQPNFDKLQPAVSDTVKETKIQQKPSLIRDRRRLYRRKPKNFVTSWKD